MNKMMAEKEENREILGTFKRIFSSFLLFKLGFLILITLLTRVLSLFQTQIISSDGVRYIQMAKFLAEGQYEEIFDFSLYSLFIFLAQKLIGDWELSGQLVSVTWSTLTVIPIFLLGQSLYDEKVGGISSICYIVSPNFLKFGSDVLRDPTNWFFIILTLYLIWEGIRKSSLVLFGFASISAGFGALTRLESSILWGIFAIYIAFQKTSIITLKRRYLSVALFMFLFPLILLFFSYFVKSHSSRMTFVNMTSFPVNYIGAQLRMVFQPKDPIKVMNQEAYNSLPMITKDSLQMVNRHRIVLAISEVIYKFIKSANFLIILILLGLWKRKKEGFKSSDRYLLYTFAALLGISFLYTRHIYYFSTRHGLTLVLPLLHFGGIGFVFFTETISRKINRGIPNLNILQRYIFLFIIIFFIAIFLIQGLSFRRTEKVKFKEIGVWLKENGYQGSVMMGPKKLLRLIFYAEGKFIEMPNSWEKAVNNINKNKVRIVVIDPCTIEQDCPGFLENWRQAGFFLLQKSKGRSGSCDVQVFGVY